MSIAMETWENVTDSVVYLPATDNRGRDRTVKIPGRGRGQISTDDRENLVSMRPGRNPFESGRLRRIDAGATPDQSTAAIPNAELLTLVDLQQSDFTDWVNTDSELNVRRLRALMRKNRLGSLIQHQVIDEVIQRRWPHLDYTREQLQLQADWEKYDDESL